jgi:flavin-dependent dehydrogenase
MYDAIVIGARCAGSPTAMLLARKGYRVLVVDRATFPSDTLSTHAVKYAATASLHRWGLLERVMATNCPPITRGTLDLGPFALSGSAPPLDGIGHACAPRRYLLDAILAEAAVAAGAELREGFSVQEIVFDDGRVAGVRGRAAGGATVEERARIVVGADGLHSLVARAVAAPVYNDRGVLCCGYYSYWSGLPVSGVEFYPRPGQVVLTFPTNDGLTVVYAGWPAARFHKVRADVEGSFMAALDLIPAFAERVRAGRREERFAGTADLPNFFRKPYGPGWALVGDAGCHKDPITGQGITDAFRDAELLAEAIDAGLTGRQSLDDALADYERRRNEAMMPIFEFICAQASLQPPPPEMVQLFTALIGNQEQIDRLLGTIENSVPIPEFFSPENIGRIVAAAPSAVGA